MFLMCSLKNNLETQNEFYFFFFLRRRLVSSSLFFSSQVSTFFFYMTQHYTINTLTPQWSQYIWGHSAVCKTSSRDSELREKLYNPLHKLLESLLVKSVFFYQTSCSLQQSIDTNDMHGILRGKINSETVALDRQTSDWVPGDDDK